MDQEPKPGQTLARGAPVVLTVSKGPQPVTCQVPDLTGKTVEQARTELEKVKLKLDENVSRVTSTDYLSGQVIAQSPAKGTEVQEGTAVQVTISDGPGPVKRIARIEAKMPDDKKEHLLRIVVTDARGTNEAYVGTHQGDKVVVKEIPYYGKANVQVYIDKKLAGEQLFE